MATPPDDHRPRVAITDGDPLAGLLQWVAEGRVDAAARERARQRWLEHQAGEEATVAGVMTDLAERGRPVAVTTRAGRNISGRIVAMGADFAVLRDDAGDVLVPFGALATIGAAPGDRPATGDRSTPLELVLAEALSELAADRPRVTLAAGDRTIRGELRSAGFDVVAVGLDGAARSTVHVAIAAIDHLVVVG